MLIGREREKELLLDANSSDDSSFIAVYGRRRVGKTYLIRETFGREITFQHSGLANGKMSQQLKEFRNSLELASQSEVKDFADWSEAFMALQKWIGSLPEGRKIIFIDELPWIDTPRSGFLGALEHFWNGWASARKDITLIVCGSATSWIINNIINNHGGLHNRLTHRISLQQFSLYECREYTRHYRLNMSDYQIMEAYMILGGVPYYWSLLDRRYSLHQNIDLLFFGPKGTGLTDEFDRLYASLFKRPEPYVAIVEALSTVRAGLTRDDIINKVGVKSGGELSRYLKELEWCGFIRKYNNFAKASRQAVYQLIDCFTIFHAKFLKSQRHHNEHFWTDNLGSPTYRAWSGISFETLCLLHVAQIKESLRIGGIAAEVYSWRQRGDEATGVAGAQIDLIIDRKDGVIDICEMKFSEDEYRLTSDEERKLRNRRAAFIEATKTRKAVRIVLVSPYGASRNLYSGIFSGEVTIDGLFMK